MLNRRSFCKYMCKYLTAAAAGAAFADLAAIKSLARAREYFQVTELGSGRWVLQGGGGNILLLKTSDGAILVDAGVGPLATELVDKVTERTGPSGLTLINTHHHPDHIGGNFAIRQKFGQDIQIVAQDNLVPRLGDTVNQRVLPGLKQAAGEDPHLAEIAAALTPEDFSPSSTFATSLELRAAGLEAGLFHYGPGHTDNDAVVHFPQFNILHMGDLIFNGLHPYVFAEHGASTTGWQHSLAKALELCDADTVVIPGHGDLAGRQALVAMSEYFDQAREIVTAAIDEGRTRQEVAQLKPAVFSERGFADVQHMTLTRIYDELTSE